MKRFLLPTTLSLLLACAGCTQPPAGQRQTPQQNAGTQQKGSQPVYAGDDTGCSTRAQKRLTMYDRPDTYPISDQERHDAYLALYSACMREHNWQVAGPVHAPGNDAAQLAALSPAAGGKASSPTSSVTAGNTLVTTSSVPGATVIVIGGSKETAAQLASLSPSSGGAQPNATVVLVSPQQQQAAPSPYAAYATGAPLPVAVPIPPPQATKAYTPSPAQPQAAARAPAQAQPPQPSLAGAEEAATGTPPPPPRAPSSDAATRQLENVLEQ